MRGLLRFFVVGFTVVSLMLVAGVGVAASGKNGSSNTVKHSVVVLFSGHSEQTSARGGTTSESSNGEGNRGNNDEKRCKPPKKHHKHATEGHEHHPCDDGSGDDSG